MTRPLLSAWLLAGLLLTPALRAAPAAPVPAPFALRDGDTVVFYGDSITEQLMYARDIETFVDTRFPAMRVRFINSGWSGDKVTGGNGGGIELRLKRDVLNYKPTVVTVFLGMNDGNYAPYDEAAFQTYAQGLTHIVDELTQSLPGVRITLLTPSFFDYDAATRPAPTTPPAYDFRHPAPDYNQTLLKYGAFVRQLGARRGLPVADLNAPMAAATAQGRKTDPKFALSADGVHPNEVGHLLMAAAVLQAWHAPATVQDLTLTPGAPVTAAAPLPWPVPDAARPAFAVSPLPGSLDVFQARLAAPRPAAGAPAPYQLRVDSQPAVPLSPTAPADLTAAPALPQNAQAQAVLTLVQQRVTAWHDFWKGRNTGLVSRKDTPTDDELGKLRAEDAALDPQRAQAHDAAQPRPHTFVVAP